MFSVCVCSFTEGLWIYLLRVSGYLLYIDRPRPQKAMLSPPQKRCWSCVCWGGVCFNFERCWLTEVFWPKCLLLHPPNPPLSPNPYQSDGKVIGTWAHDTRQSFVETFASSKLLCNERGRGLFCLHLKCSSSLMTYVFLWAWVDVDMTLCVGQVLFANVLYSLC